MTNDKLVLHFELLKRRRLGRLVALVAFTLPLGLSQSERASDGYQKR